MNGKIRDTMETANTAIKATVNIGIKMTFATIEIMLRVLKK